MTHKKNKDKFVLPKSALNTGFYKMFGFKIHGVFENECKQSKLTHEARR